MFRAQIVRGNVGQGRILRGIFLSGVFFYLSAPSSVSLVQGGQIMSIPQIIGAADARRYHF